ncbi:hypothetical protein [Lacrimispora sp.]|uniref:hypothetical protein n=1 Tax=Lacrimispora sp. TaxID=2719234 RepID=UPI0032E391B4
MEEWLYPTPLMNKKLYKKILYWCRNLLMKNADKLLEKDILLLLKNVVSVVGVFDDGVAVALFAKES